MIPASLRRIRALVLKETRQLIRDPASLAMGLVMPVLLIVLFGYGLSLDVDQVRIAIVLEVDSAAATEQVAGFMGSAYYVPTFVQTWPAAEEMMRRREVDAILRIPADHARRRHEVHDQRGDLQLVVHGGDVTRARIIERYVQGTIASRAGGPAAAVDRLWFNEANQSTWFLVPGLIVLVMTLIGAFMTALVVAREWERGTLEALFVTPVRAGEILLAKMVPYFVLGMSGFMLCLLAGRLLFHVPLRGSPLVLIAVSMLYLLVALGIGLLISSVVRSQFVASQVALFATFLPAVLLSGFLFDTRSMPAAARAITYLIPARYYVSLLQTIFLAGDVWGVIVPNAAALLGMAIVLLALARAATRKTLT